MLNSHIKFWNIQILCVSLHCENQVGGQTLNFTDFVNIRKIGLRANAIYIDISLSCVVHHLIGIVAFI